MTGSRERKVTRHVVSFLDILGYKDIVKDERKMDGLLDAMLDAVKTASDAAERLIEKNKANYGEGNTKIDTLKHRAFSDNIVISCELYEEPKDEFEHRVNGVAIGTVLMIQAHIQTRLLIEHGLLSRGGATIGDYYIDENFVFGSGLVDAFELENNAEYPRILVDELLMNTYTKSAEKAGYRGDYSGAFLEDFDGEWYVHYLRFGMWLRKILFDEDLESEYKELLQKHEAAVSKLFAENKETIGKKRKLRRKYAWVAGYHERISAQQPAHGTE